MLLADFLVTGWFRGFVSGMNREILQNSLEDFKGLRQLIYITKYLNTKHKPLSTHKKSLTHAKNCYTQKTSHTQTKQLF
jgi:hypothetical protein